MHTSENSGQPLWVPPPERIAQTHMVRFMRRVAGRTGEDLKDYSALYRWSVARPADFWGHLRVFAGVIGEGDWDPVLEKPDAMPGARWFPRARLNFAENLLRRDDRHEALVFWDEAGRRSALTYAELGRQVARASSVLARLGVGRGDRLAAVLPNRPETVVAMLAAARLGAVWSSCSPDFGVEAVLDRLGQVAPKVLLCTDGYRFKGRVVDVAGRSREIAARLETVQHLVHVPADGSGGLGVPCALDWEDLIAPGHEAAPPFARLPFDHPLYILFSSGTTGRPKCIVHGAGGTLLQHLKELVLHTDLGPGDRLFYYTSTGWMMWNWMVSALATGATLVLYDGSPFHPEPRALMDLIEAEAITCFGTSAKYISALEKAGVRPAQSHDLSALRAILSTGSPLAPESFDYVYRHIKSDLQLSSISGGTDIVSCFALGCPLLPVHRGQLQCRGLGMAVDIYDADGRPLRGAKGELVCTKPFPSMPVGFWGDADGSRYRGAYFERFPGVWAHGDFAELTPQDGVVIYGRSDAVLNPGGVRIGTAEIYRQVEALPEVAEAIAVGQRWQEDERVVLFLVLREGVELDDALKTTIRRVLRERASPRHVPARILQVDAIPRTRSGKIVELAVRAVIHGEPVENLDSLANPEALEGFRNRPELKE